MCCYKCRFYDDTDTSLPVCRLLRKYVYGEWLCDKFATRN